MADVRLDIDATTWAQLSELLDTALELPAQQREGWLAGLDGQHDALKPRLRDLLARAARLETSDFLDALPKLRGLPAQPPVQPGVAPGRIGPYRLLRELGSGGMGSVWLAERSDGLLHRHVALKFPRGTWLLAGLRERMARERQILAALEHPGIARLYDAGVTDAGDPYLALEYVDGLPIDQHCASHVPGVQQRLRLFLQVADAVAYAHAKLIVHRDLKPANILVTSAGQVRLLDFGVGKLLDEQQARGLTELAGQAMTLEYASPEQIAGEPAAVAADVYSLGVVLYELLTGQPPYRPKRTSRAALEEAILTVEPPRPSQVVPETMARRLRGDLDAITLKALRKDPGKRYATVEALAQDLRRHLDGHPVLARPPHPMYRLRKFVRRHRYETAGTIALVIALAGGFGVAFWQAQLARAEQRRAEQVKDFIATIFKEANPFQVGSGNVLSGVELLRLARDRLTAAPPDDAATLVELLNLLGSGLLALEDANAAESVLERAAEQGSRHLGSDHRATLRAEVLRAEAARMLEKPDEARVLLERQLPALRRAAARQPAELTAALVVGARLAANQTRFDDVDALVNEGLDVIDRHLGGRHADRQALLSVSALTLRQRGMGPEALRVAELAWQQAQSMHPNTRHPVVADTQLAYAHALADNGRFRESMAAVRAVLADTEALFGPDSRRLATRLGSTAEIFAEAGAVAEGIHNAERSRAILQELVPAGSRLDGASSEVVALARMWSREGDLAVPEFERAERIYEALFGAEHWVVLVTRRNRSLALTYAGRLDEAERVLADVQSRSPLLARDSYDANAWIAGVRERLQGRLPEALRWQEQALASMPETAGNQTPRGRALAERGLVWLEMGRVLEARADLERALDIFTTSDAGMVAASADAELGLARIELADGRAADALRRLERVDDFWDELGVRHRWAGEAAFWRARAHAALEQEAAAAAARTRAIEGFRHSTLPGDRTLLAELQSATH